MRRFEIRILGTIGIVTDGSPEHDPLGSAKERHLLAALAVDVSRPVTLDMLTHRLWDEDPPKKPRSSLHSYAARLRRRMRAAESEDPSPRNRIVQEAHSYLLDADPDRVDWHRFRALVAAARSLLASGDDAQALALLRQARDLWRGEALGALTGPWAERTRRQMEEERVAAELSRISIELRNGNFADVVGELTALVTECPTDETAIGYLMIAMYGSGRQSEALHMYESARRLLRTELGTDPGEVLEDVHRRILARVPRAELMVRPASSVPATSNLPSHGDLIGRAAELCQLRSGASNTASVGLWSVSGMPGVGKTSLALHAARTLAEEYPDGQLYLDLRGHSPGEQPLAPQAALTALLRLMGVPTVAVPSDLDELSALWRTMLSTRRVVVVLDDAAGADQVRRLLASRSRSLIIMTSRRRLAGLPGVRSVSLDVLPVDDAITLFTQLAGPTRAEDRSEARTIAHLCGYLPLAIELAAGRLRSRPSWSAGHLIRRLSRSHGRLIEIRDGYREIARVFEISYLTLTPDEQTAFRTLSTHLGADIDPHAAAALTGLPLDETERTLETLLDASLVQEPAPDRFRFHDLVGEYARALTFAEDPEGDRESRIRCLIDFYVLAVDKADRLVFPRRARLEICGCSGVFALPNWRDAGEARHWLTLERPALIAAERHARTQGRSLQAAQLAHVLSAFLNDEGYWGEAQRMHQHAADFWHDEEDPRAEARTLIDLATVCSHASQYDKAAEAGQRALAAARAVGDSEGEAEALHLLGGLSWNLGRLDQARDYQMKTLEYRERQKDVWQIARGQNNLAVTNLYLGSHESAMELFTAALAGFREMGDLREESNVLNNLSDLFMALGDRTSARKFLEQSLHITRDLGSEWDYAVTQVNLANILNAAEGSDAVLNLHREAAFTFRRLGDRRNEAVALNGMGEVLQSIGRYGEAVAHHQSAHALAERIGAAHEVAQSLRLLGTAELHLGQLDVASGTLGAALALSQAIHAAGEEDLARSALATLRARDGDGGRGRHVGTEGDRF